MSPPKGNLGNMRHHLIVGAIDSVLVIKRHWQAEDGSLGSGRAKGQSRSKDGFGSTAVYPRLAREQRQWVMGLPTILASKKSSGR
jgi:hypothetical protein